MTTTNKPMTGEQLDELMTVSVNMQRESERLGDRAAAMFAYAVQVAVLELRSLKTREFPVEFISIAENIRTQDNRITSYPMFCVYQKREVVADADYDHDRIVWVDDDGNEASERKRMRLELLHANYREPPEKWRRVAVKEIDDFVTCCFTEQGCKDYLACNGHNLRLPFIYVKSGFRNAEYIGIRDWLAGITVKGE